MYEGAAEDLPLASLSLTHVHYNPDDPVSLICAYLSLLPQAIIIVYVTLLWAHRELEVGLAFAGQLGCEAVNWVLKRLIRETRPSQRFASKGYGMPSSHAQFSYFFAFYLSLWVLSRVRYMTRPMRLFVAVNLQIMAAAVAASRVYLEYHSPKQVFVGMGVGALLGIVWFVVTDVLRLVAGGVFWDILLDNKLSKLLYVKDMCTELELQKMEWTVWSSERAQRKQVGQDKQAGKPRLDVKKRL